MQLGLVTCLGQVIIVVTLGSCADWLKLSQSSKSLLASQEEGSSSLLVSLLLVLSCEPPSKSGVPVADVAASDIGRLSGIVVWYC